MSDLEQILKRATDLHGQGRWAEAEQLYRQVLRADKNQTQALVMLGVLAMQVGVPMATLSGELGDELLPFLFEPDPTDVGPPPAGGTGAPLAMGIAFHYRVGKIAPYVRSLRRHYAGDAVLFTNDPGLTPFLAEYRIENVVCDNIGLKASPTFLRYGYYHRHLRRHAGHYDRVLLSDVGDVIFQADPFALDMPGRLLTFCESEPMSIAQSPINAQWVMNAFGDAMYRALGSKSIVCGGVTMGDAASVLSYVKLTLLLAAQMRADRVRAFGYDQATHNAIVHFGLIDGTVIMENHRHVATLGGTPREDIVLAEDGAIRHKSGHASAIVHQYNYHPDLDARIRALYGAG